mgnify:CR=1 FL=1
MPHRRRSCRNTEPDIEPGAAGVVVVEEPAHQLARRVEARDRQVRGVEHSARVFTRRPPKVKVMPQVTAKPR